MYELLLSIAALSTADDQADYENLIMNFLSNHMDLFHYSMERCKNRSRLAPLIAVFVIIESSLLVNMQ